MAGSSLKNRGHLVNIVGYLLTGASIFYLVDTVRKLGLASIKIEISLPLFLFLAVSVCAYSFVLFLLGFSWELILEFISRKPIATKDIFPVFANSNMAKYLPGNVFQYAARNFLGNRLGWKHSDIALSSLFEVILGVVISLLVLTILFFAGFLNVPGHWLAYIRAHGKILSSGVFIVIVSLCGFLVFGRDFITRLDRFFSRKDFYVLFLKISAIYISFFVVSGVMLALLYGFTGEVDLKSKDVAVIAGAFVLSYFAGYVVPGSPGGMGIREAFLVLMLGPLYGTACTLAASLIHRFIAMAGDVVIFLAGWLNRPGMKRTRK